MQMAMSNILPSRKEAESGIISFMEAPIPFGLLAITGALMTVLSLLLCQAILNTSLGPSWMTWMSGLFMKWMRLRRMALRSLT